uniref:Uncharacterized protein n=1 Tax=Ixodes ricinus TaxID=34613 RepID=A0A6B0UZU7_IXORI
MTPSRRLSSLVSAGAPPSESASWRSQRIGQPPLSFCWLPVLSSGVRLAGSWYSGMDILLTAPSGSWSALLSSRWLILLFIEFGDGLLATPSLLSRYGDTVDESETSVSTGLSSRPSGYSECKDWMELRPLLRKVTDWVKSECRCCSCLSPQPGPRRSQRHLWNNLRSSVCTSPFKKQ